MTSNAPPTVSPASRAGVDIGESSAAAVPHRRTGAGVVRERFRLVNETRDPREHDVADRRQWLARRSRRRPELTAPGSGRNTGSGLSRAGALEHVADIVVAVLEGTGEVGVAGRGRVTSGRLVPLASAASPPRTAMVCCQFTHVAIDDLSSAIGRAGRPACRHPCADSAAVALDFAPPAAPRTRPAERRSCALSASISDRQRPAGIAVPVSAPAPASVQTRRRSPPKKTQHLRSILYEGSAFFRSRARLHEGFRLTRWLQLVLAWLPLPARSASSSYAPNRAWLLVTGEPSVAGSRAGERCLAAPTPGPLTELLTYRDRRLAALVVMAADRRRVANALAHGGR
jgi:hypothetical protein